MNKSFETLQEKLAQLRLGSFIQHMTRLYETDLQQAEALSHRLEEMVDDELACRKERSVKTRIKDAQFIRIQTIDNFDFNYNPATRKLRKRYLQLFGADMAEQHIGAVFVGNSGLGKTHLARALGYAACQRGQKVLFMPCSAIVNRLITAEATKDLEREIKKFLNPALTIIDELGYFTLSPQEANLFFQVVSRRYDHNRPIVVTTNKAFGQWNQVFHDDATAHAIVDRLTEKAEIFYLEGKSYRETHREGLKVKKEKQSTPAQPGKKA
jgi:DNA replication protein DnaC